MDVVVQPDRLQRDRSGHLVGDAAVMPPAENGAIWYVEPAQSRHSRGLVFQ